MSTRKRLADNERITWVIFNEDDNPLTLNEDWGVEFGEDIDDAVLFDESMDAVDRLHTLENQFTVEPGCYVAPVIVTEEPEQEEPEDDEEEITKALVQFDKKHGCLPKNIVFDDVYDWPQLQQLSPCHEQGIEKHLMTGDMPEGAVEIAHYNKERDTLEISYKAKKNFYTKTFSGDQFEITYEKG